MKKAALALVVALVLALLGSFGTLATHTVAAQDTGCGMCGVAAGDPAGPDSNLDAQCVASGGTSVPFDDADGFFFGWGCFALPTDGGCPDGTILTEPGNKPGPEWEVCAGVSGEGLQTDGGGHQPWRDGPRGHCTLDTYQACQAWQQNGGEKGDGNGPQDGSGKAVFPVIGPGYVANTNGDGVVCRATPGGDEVTTLPEGAKVTELADGVDDGWQLVAYSTGNPSCYIDAQYLSDTAPATGTPPVTAGNDASANSSSDTNAAPAVGGQTDAPVNGVTVVSLPVTGVRPLGHRSWFSDGFHQLMLAMVALLCGGLAWSSRNHRRRGVMAQDYYLG